MRKWIKIVMLIVICVSSVTLWFYSRKQQQEKYLHRPTVHLDTQNSIALLNEMELIQALKSTNLYYDSIQRKNVDLKQIESYLLALNEIEKVQVFMELSGRWHLDVLLRKPILRVIPEDSDQFYIDSRGKAMWVTSGIRPRILSVTGLKSNHWNGRRTREIINNDSLITISPLRDSYLISKYVCNSAFYDALIVQMHYSEEDGFILIPRIGYHKIILGNATSYDEVVEKFNKLTTFYKEVIPYEGWGKYHTVNLKFKDQIVAKKK